MNHKYIICDENGVALWTFESRPDLHGKRGRQPRQTECVADCSRGQIRLSRNGKFWFQIGVGKLAQPDLIPITNQQAIRLHLEFLNLGECSTEPGPLLAAARSCE